ncbi:MAG: terminase small subunit, partial [Candidatus Krumholzibacteria bacterium]|nr:terminase small subunit [Candidatus Krumholzibacteria bacterium]
MEAPKKQLTELERRFAAEYAVCCNGAAAARAAGYSDSATGSARVMAHKLMKKPAVRELVDRLIRERAERVELRGDQIVADLQRLARWSLVPVAVLDK